MASTLYNPRGDETNCGFCAVSYALERLKLALPGKNVKWSNADDLYDRKLKRLRFTPDEAKGFPRELIFPEQNWSGIPARGQYAALTHGTRALSDYTITKVASDEGLVYGGQGLLAGGRPLTQSEILGDNAAHFFAWYMENGVGRWKFDDFMKLRLNFLEDRFERTGGNFDRAGAQMAITKALAGDSIVGSKKTNHFMNVSIDPVDSHVDVYDPQTGDHFDGKGLQGRLREVNLFMHLEKTVSPETHEVPFPPK